MAELNTSNIELTSIVDQNFKAFVPKIRIRLRLDSDQLNDSYQKILTDQSKRGNDSNEIMNQSSETKCYKILEDSGGGGGSEDSENKDKEAKHNYMIHGINLRARLPKPINICKKLKTNEIRMRNNKRIISNQAENDFNNKSTIKSLCTKNSYKLYIPYSSKNHRRKEKSNRRSTSKVCKEFMDNFNLKEIVNHENFLKLSQEIQWQLANLLPTCDKPKSSNKSSNCHCTDTFPSINESNKINPNIHYTALNNEFLGKALAKYSMKMGHCELINLMISERENLRSRPVSYLNNEHLLIESIENEVKLKEFNNNNTDEDNERIFPDEIKSNSSVCTTETVEMNGAGNNFENISLKVEQCKNNENSCVELCDSNHFVEKSNDNCDEVHEAFSQHDNDSINDYQCDKVSVSETKVEVTNQEALSPIDKSHTDGSYPELKTNFQNLTQHLSIVTNNVEHELNTPILFDDKRRKRGRKRKCFSFPDDIFIVPVKRSNRSTAGKRPARLDFESPPTSPSVIPNFDKKMIHNKFKKQKERNRNNRNFKSKQGHSSDEIDNIIKMESKQHFLSHELTSYSKKSTYSPDSLPTESNISPLSKMSSNGSSLLSGFCQSTFVSLYNDKKMSNHANSVQALSPSWSCTSESTTPSVKSDNGQIQPTRNSPTLNSSIMSHIESKIAVEPETKSIQGMPPPRQTLTLAAMREKMRAKKLAKEDNRKDPPSLNKRVSSNNQKNKKQNNESISLLKEADDDFQLMDKMLSSSEEFDELLNNSQDSLLKFFMGDDNYTFEANVDPCSNISLSNITSPNPVKSKPVFENAFNKSDISRNCVKTVYREQENVTAVSETVSNNQSPLPINKGSSSPSCNESTQSEKSIADTIATVLQKLNNSKEKGVVINNNNNNNNCNTKTSVPSAYLVDGNGLSTALSMIQSLNPGAKVTTQQFYLVNSGPQLILQPSPPTNNIVSDKQLPLNLQSKVSLAPKIANQPSILSSSSIHDGFPTISLNQLPSSSSSLLSSSLSSSFPSSRINDKPFNITSESTQSHQLRSAAIKMALGELKHTQMMSPIAPNLPQHFNNTLQTISTPHPIGLVHSVQPSIPSLFSSQLRFIHPTQTPQLQQQSNTISLITPNISSVNNHPIINNNNNNNSNNNNNQSPKLLFLCPTVTNNNNNSTVATANVINQDQKYLLVSKQPDKQATIQLVSSQALWQHLNPTMISQTNNLLLMQQQPINNFDSIICSNIHNNNNHNSKQQQQQFIETSPTSSLIIDSRSLISKLTSPPMMMMHDDFTAVSLSSSSSLLPSSVNQTITTSGVMFNTDDHTQS